MNPNELLNSLNWRYAVKKFDSEKKIDSTSWSALENALLLTPSSYGLQPWKFHIITNSELKQQLLEHSWKQKQIVDCSHLVVFTSKTSIDEQYLQRYINSITSIRKVELQSLDGFKKVMMSDLIAGPRAKWIDEWATRQTYIALGNFMTAAALIGVDTCALEGIIPTEYDKILKLEGSSYKTVVACAAGYRATDDKYQNVAKVRFSTEEIIVKHS